MSILVSMLVTTVLQIRRGIRETEGYFAIIVHKNIFYGPPLEPSVTTYVLVEK